MDYGPYYSIYELARAAEVYLRLIDIADIRFFLRENIPYDRKEILCAIQIGGKIKSDNNQVPITSHPAIHSAIKGVDFYEKKFSGEQNKGFEMLGTVLYNELIWLVGSMINLIYDVYVRSIENAINKMEYFEAIKHLTVERQSDKLDNTHPKKFIDKYKEYLNKRIDDIKELIQIEELNFGNELKEILISYKLGLEVNVKGRNLLTPLLKRDYDDFIKNLKNSLLIPSYYDVQKKEKERYYHVYLLGVLEGRLNFYKLQSNKESGFGRYDICAIPIHRTNPGIIIEVKADDSIIGDDALGQVRVNEYIAELRNDGIKEVLVLAINFKEKSIETKHEVLHVSA